jgi:hypothetical protein
MVIPPLPGGGLKLYDPKTAPVVFDVVWCKFPVRENPDEPGPWVRAVLVVDVELMEDVDGTEWAAVTAAYGTGADNVVNLNEPRNLLIPRSEYRALGLHKPTVFQLDVSNQRRMPWGEKYFVTQGYVKNQNIICGSLNAGQQTKFHDCFKKLGRTFPLK